MSFETGDLKFLTKVVVLINLDHAAAPVGWRF